MKLEHLKATWTSAVYSFFKSDVYVAHDADRQKYQFFPCAAKSCKSKLKGVRHYQDGKDCASTGNLKKHAVTCFSQAAVDNAIQGNDESKAKHGSIFAAFARVGQHVLKATHCNHNYYELRVCLAHWVTESNQSVRIVEDDGFIEIIGGGRPDLQLLSCTTLTQDITTAYNILRNCITKLLQDHPSVISIATDAWTSPNH
ncbi:hypothetical protein Moror_13289 [Moniliophthora roreri MCA 2997]|uniref:Uncharacterized protein n=1 Tax=Moniliophthora roreri (strain MCA 2997) TaxID=1381753 RepID=V2WCW7_MONRO|nr:hypothetical protein Moror_13289 [Moniliophthora roreri MCA 2997]